MGKPKARAAAIAFAVGAGLLSFALLPAATAYADPPSCSKHIDNFYGGGKDIFGLFVSGHCVTNPAYRVLHAEVKQDLPWRPDPVALAGAESGLYYDYYASATGCDHNNTAVYYGRVFFEGYSDYLDTAHNTYDSC